ncbi:MAG: AI-2E family transporter [Nitrospinota bacterium]|nr:AI-2E family transporter [Nitrospinota bacterium]
MNTERNGNTPIFYLIVFLVALVLIYLTRRVLTPFFIAFALAYLLDPLVDRMENCKIPRSAGIILLMTAFFLVIFLGGVLLTPVMQTQVEKLTADVPVYIQTVQQWIAPFVEKLSTIDPAKTREFLNEGMKKFGELPFKIMTSATSVLWSSLSGLVNIIFMVINLVIIPVAMFYLLRDFDELSKKCLALIPPRFKDKILGVLEEINQVLAKFLRGQLMVATLMAGLYSIGLQIAGAPMSLLIGIVAGYANLVPYLGVLLGLVPASLLTYLHYQEWFPVLMVLGVFGVVQALEGMVISPRLLGEQVGLHPVALMIAILIGAEFFGLLGVLLAVPFAAVINIFLKRGLIQYKNSTFYQPPQ